jgi:two-component system OmpR family response regulator
MLGFVYQRLTNERERGVTVRKWTVNRLREPFIRRNIRNPGVPRLLSVDDDPDINELISNFFGMYGFDVIGVQTGAAMRAAIAGGGIDIVLLDLGLPGEDGLDLARHLRQTWNGPVIIVSGRGGTVDRVVGLEVGADDYVTKPFDLRELLARVKSVMRRAAPGANAGAVSVGDPDGTLPPRYAFGDWTLDTGARRLVRADATEVTLTRGEFDLLLALVERPQRVVTRDQLMEIIYNRDAGPFDRTIDVQIGRLRKKIEKDAQQPQIIKAVRGLGYQFAVEVARLPAGGTRHG